MYKAELRKIYQKKRAELEPEAAAEMSRLIAAKFIEYAAELPLRYLSCYLPILKFNEIDTHPLINEVRNEFPECSITVPRSDLNLGTMINVLFELDTKLAENRWGISEPVEGKTIAADLFDVVIVPLLCFDKYGDRVGYGKGFYDRFLAECRPDCKKIGLNYFEPVDVIKDPNSTDVKLDAVITPQKIFEF